MRKENALWARHGFNLVMLVAVLLFHLWHILRACIVFGPFNVLSSCAEPLQLSLNSFDGSDAEPDQFPSTQSSGCHAPPTRFLVALLGLFALALF